MITCVTYVKSEFNCCKDQMPNTKLQLLTEQMGKVMVFEYFIISETGHITSHKSSVYRHFARGKKWGFFVFPPWKFSPLTKSAIFILKISLVCKLFLRINRHSTWCLMPRFRLKAHTLKNIFTSNSHIPCN